MKKLLLTSISVLALFATQAQNVGIGTNNPQTKLQVEGAISATPQSGVAGTIITIAANVSVFRITDDGATAANAATATSPKEGQYLTIYNTDADAATFAGQTISSGATASFNYISGAWRLTSKSDVSGSGATGPTGAAGTNGTNGTNGSDGATGPTGPTGAAGTNGTNGTNGSDGATGPTGPTGAAGTNGTNGSNGATGPTGATGLLSAGTATGQTPYWNGSAWVIDANIYNNGGNVGIGNTPNANAKLDITSTTSGVLIPRLTLADRNTNLTSPPTGLLIYQTDNTPGFYYYNGSAWVRISESTNGIQSVGVVAPLQSTGGQNPTLSIPQANSTTNGFLSSADWTTFNNKLGTSLSNGRVWVGDGSNVAQPTAITGDATLSNTGVLTLANSGVTAGPYGSATTVPVVTVDAKGRITGVTTTTISGVAPGGAAGGGLTGNYPNPIIANNAVSSAEIADGTVATADLANANVTYAKIQNVPASRLLGNPTGSAAPPSEISLGTGLSFSGTTLNSTGGTVTSVSGTSPITVTNGTTTPAISLGTVGVTNGGTGTTSQFTQGSVVFAGASGVYAQNNSNFFWDNTNSRLGIGNNSPPSRLTIGGTSQIVEIQGGGSLLLRPADNSWDMRLQSVGQRLDVLSGGSLGTPIASFLHGGNVGIGTTSPAFAIDVIGTIRVGGSTGKISMTNDNINGNITNSAGSFLFFTPASSNYVWHVNNAEQMRLTSSGNLCMGTTTERAKLTIEGTGPNQTMAAYYAYINTGPCCGIGAGQVVPYSLYTSGRVWVTGELDITSDVRTKNILGISDPKADLAMVNSLDVVDYKYKDVVAKGSHTIKGFKAQQVKEVFPMAVTENTDIIPNIYAAAQRFDFENGTLTVNLKEPADVKAGDKIKLIGNWGSEVFTVSKATVSSFSIDNFAYKPDFIFVYGTEKNDVLNLDYNKIFSAGISAIQELTRKVKILEQQNLALQSSKTNNCDIEKLKAENSQLKVSNETLQRTKADLTDLDLLKAEINYLKDVIQKAEK